MGAFFFTIILFVIFGGFISWKFISYKEKRCIEKCKAMGNVSWSPRLDFWSKIKPGLILGYILGLFSFMVDIVGFDMTDSAHRFMIIMGGSFMGIILLIVEWFFLSRIPIFAIVDDTLVLWKYFGWVSPKKYALSELTRDGHYASVGIRYVTEQNLIIGLYKRGDRIMEIDTTAYEQGTKILEKFRQIPYEPED